MITAMDENEITAALYEKDTAASYKKLLEMEMLSERSDALYDYMDEFFDMLDSPKYTIRVRGFRLICKQAKWDKDKKIDRNIDKILSALGDAKPTAVRQFLQFLAHDVVPYKKELRAKIKDAALAVDLTKFAGTMRPLLEKDVGELIRRTGIA